jgi:KaiC/GvpD/RAD55 family RecA-like ATPase
MDEFLNDPTLVDPDASDDQVKYLWDEEFQRHVIALLISDRQFLLSSIDLVKPSYFTAKAHQKACSIVFKFFKKYRILPRKDFLVQEIKTELKDDKALAYYLAEVNVLYDYFQPGLDARDYLQDKIAYFAKIQAVKSAFHRSLKEIDKAPEDEDTWSKIYELMREAMTTDQNFDLGIDYFMTIKDRYAKQDDEHEEERFKTGIRGIDKEITGGGYIRGEIISVIAGSGVGKSVMLACITATNLLRGKKGVYISLELAESKVAERMDAILTGFPIQCLHDHKDEIFDKLDTLEGIYREEKMGSLVIKQFPSGQATVNTIRAYISQLRFNGFDPDFVIVDYVGEMANDPNMKTYESREKVVRDLRGMATEENIFIATAMQPNRDSKSEQKNERHRIDDQHLADSFGQIRPLDGCFSLNQNDSEKQLGMGRCYIIKQRDGKSRYQVWLRFDKENLKITEISQDTYRKAMVVHKERVNEEVAMDEISEATEVVGTWGDLDDESEKNES